MKLVMKDEHFRYNLQLAEEEDLQPAETLPSKVTKYPHLDLTSLGRPWLQLRELFPAISRVRNFDGKNAG